MRTASGKQLKVFTFMRLKKRQSASKRPLFPAFLLIFTLLPHTLPSSAQTLVEPRREQLLNGLNVLLWPRPADKDVLLKLRINSGASFDLAGKSGLMAILGDILFPETSTREFFSEELGGKLNVTTDYDSITVTMKAPAAEYERLVDQFLRTALLNTPITVENVNKLRDARLKLVREAAIVPALVADRAITARLFGDYPLGRPISGTPESLARIERADLLFARERFLNPNNATLAIVGGVEPLRAMRALRQLLGGWRKSDQTVPATFRQPDEPNARTLVIDLPATDTAEIRLAVRGLSHSDKDAAVARLIELLTRDHWLAAMPALKQSAFFVRNESHTLPGIFVLGASVPASSATDALSTARKVLSNLAAAQPTAQELERARIEAIAELNKRADQTESAVDLWLDGETYKLGSPAQQIHALNAVTATDVQRVSARLFRSLPVAAVAVGKATVLSADLSRTENVEIFGAPTATPKTEPAKAPVKKP